MVVEGAKRGICFIAHIKINNALFPQTELENQLQGHPAGSSLTLEATIAEKKRKAAAAAAAAAAGSERAALEHHLVENEMISSRRELKPGESDSRAKGAKCVHCKESRSYWHCSSPACSFASVCRMANRGCWEQHLRHWAPVEESGVAAKRPAYATPKGKGKAAAIFPLDFFQFES